ncbi:hypothetical protein Zmor_016253 [Zophobas morio]|uniref:Uncharacterized protein n=1 Tax=Zophobas morio TaxID=2755281 RepID=A0AA38IKX5_9CUCU|nr:hypothetical protein Zmor_016253 [Zophobas morio]
MWYILERPWRLTMIYTRFYEDMPIKVAFTPKSRNVILLQIRLRSRKCGTRMTIRLLDVSSSKVFHPADYLWNFR